MADISVVEPYAPGLLAPAVRAGQNLGILTQGAYRFFRVLFVEGVPASPETTQNLGSIAANTTGSSTEITVVDAQEGNLIQTRMEVLDDFEAQVSQVLASGRFTTFTQHVRVTPFLRGVDPHLSTTTMFVLGNTRSIFVTPTNPTDYAIGQSRLRFWGWRFVLDRLTSEQESVLGKVILNEDSKEDRDALRDMGIRAVTLVPAEGREV